MDISQRINRIIGQLRGIQKMSESKRECSDILQQVSAVKKAIDSLSKEMVISDICKLLPKERSEKLEKMMDRMINL